MRVRVSARGEKRLQAGMTWLDMWWRPEESYRKCRGDWRGVVLFSGPLISIVPLLEAPEVASLALFTSVLRKP